MTAADLLRHVRGAGFTLDVADGKLLVTPASLLTDDLRAALRTHKGGLLELLAAEHEAFEERAGIMEFDGGLPRAEAEVAARHCVDCEHLGPRGTCFEPVAAGLRTEQEGYGIAWPDEGQATTCQAFSAKVPQLGQERPHKLTREQLHVAHAEPWTGADIAQFQARTAAIQRHGYGEQDAEDLAEQLHLRDVGREPMVMCMECSHYRPGRCGNHRAAGLATNVVGRELATTFQHCGGFKEN